MGEIHINVWRENLEEGMTVFFVQKGVCAQNGKPRYELELVSQDGDIHLSFWTTEPFRLVHLLHDCLRVILASRNAQ